MKWTLSLVFALCLQTAFAQENTDVTYLDAKGRKTSEKKASSIVQRVRYDDTLWVFSFYDVLKPMTRAYACFDEQGNILNGEWLHYAEGGSVDTTGNYSRNVRTGTWKIYTLKRRKLKEIHYEQGRIVWEKDSTELNRERDSTKLADSLARNGKPNLDKESQFVGGNTGWIRYLNRNFRYPDIDVNNEIMGEIRVEFRIDSLGVVSPQNIWIVKSVEFHMDQECIRLIRQTPNWEPAIHNGKPVKSYKIQPIVFKMEGPGVRKQ